jgi:hypothetical protein
MRRFGVRPKIVGRNGQQRTHGVMKKQEIYFGSNRNKPKLNLFWVTCGLLRETKKYFFD